MVCSGAWLGLGLGLGLGSEEFAQDTRLGLAKGSGFFSWLGLPGAKERPFFLVGSVCPPAQVTQARSLLVARVAALTNE